VIERSDIGAAIVALDCSPITLASREDHEWFRKLVLTARPAEMLLRIGNNRNDADDDEPIASFDSASGSWWAGRYIGEVQFEGRVLRIEPRFGMPALLRWLTTIWGVRLTDSKGRYQHQRIWLWLVIAHLWSGRLIAAAKHGLPYKRIERVHYGRSLRGRLLARNTALIRAVGGDRLVSMTRVRVVDPDIGGVLLAAFDSLCTVLGHRGERNSWLPDRGRTLVDDLASALGTRTNPQIKGEYTKIRYSPMTENYRSIVDLSLSILAQRPRLPSSGGDGKAFGVLLDMAEIWELYVAKLLQIGLPELRVSHTGRATKHFRWLLRNSIDEDRLGSLRPDIVIADHNDRCVAIVDAKYKTSRINVVNRTGVATDDLYQLAAYLSGFGEPMSRLDGFLIYPDDEGGQVAQRLAPKNPWTFESAPQRRLWFVTAKCGGSVDPQIINASERAMAVLIQSAIAGNGAN